ncbi:MAG: repair protein RadC [Pseudomonadota bacterium]
MPALASPPSPPRTLQPPSPPRYPPAALRPRERLLAHGPQALADVELLALLLRTGCRGRSVLQVAQAALDRLGGVAGLAGLPALADLPGLGPAKQATLAAVFELARRALAEPLRTAPVFTAPAQVRHYLMLELGALPHEVFAVLFLDSQHRLIALRTLFRGTLAQTSVYPREVVKEALACNAGAVVLAHNHPSGTAEPSRADEFLTQTLKSALALVDVRVLDHIVVGRGQSVSFAERGLL